MDMILSKDRPAGVSQHADFPERPKSYSPNLYTQMYTSQRYRTDSKRQSTHNGAVNAKGYTLYV